MSYPYQSAPATTHTVYYSHSITIGGDPVGSFEKISMSADRATERIREVMVTRGAQVKEIVWGGTDITITLTKVEIYKKSLFQALGFEIFTLEDLNCPLQVYEIQTFPPAPQSPAPAEWRGVNDQPTGSRTIVYVDCVPKSYSKDIDTGAVRVVENMTLDVRTIKGYVA